jgi:hypothetical protein
MRGPMVKSLILSISLLASSPAFAASFPDNGRVQSALSYPGAPKPTSNDPKPPYPMNYTDEAAQTLGVKDGRWDLFSSHPAANNVFMPAVSGSVSGKGAMLRLQWHPGE